MFKKLICIFCALCLLITCLCSCEKKPEITEDTTSIPQISLDEQGNPVAQARLVYSKNDSLNPYEAESSVNLALTSLIYDGLFTLDSAYNLIGVIAKGCINGKTSLNVMIDTSVKFSDGSLVTVDDIISSFEIAKESDNYSERLKNFKSVSSSNASNLVFTLENPDIFAKNCLTFPIIKQFSDEENPIGSGRYIVKEFDGTVLLQQNPYRKGFSPSINCFELTEIKDSSNVNTSLEIGNTCFGFDDLSSGEYSRINASAIDVLLNNLVYLGVNGASYYMWNAFLRRAVSKAIDRNEIVTSAFQGHAKATETPFNPDWFALSGTQGLLTNEETSVEQLIESSGMDISGTSFTLLVNEDNEFKLETAISIAKMLEEYGIHTDIKSLPYGEYLEAIRDGLFDLYIGEMRLTANMDLTELFHGGRCSRGVSEDMQEQSYPRYQQMLAGECELMDFVNIFSTELPFIPLCYRSGMALYTNSLSHNDVGCCDADIYGNVDSWAVAKGWKQ